MIDSIRLDQLTKAMATLATHASSYDGHCYRVTKPKFGNARDALSGKGSQYAAGRYHTQGAFLIVYSSSTPEGALWEFTLVVSTERLLS